MIFGTKVDNIPDWPAGVQMVASARWKEITTDRLGPKARLAVSREDRIAFEFGCKRFQRAIAAIEALGMRHAPLPSSWESGRKRQPAKSGSADRAVKPGLVPGIHVRAKHRGWPGHARP
jgi:hypothetical protein